MTKRNRKAMEAGPQQGKVLAGAKVEGARIKQVRTRAESRRALWEYTRAIGLAVLLALVIRQFVIQAFRIPTGSMERTLLVGDFLFVNKFVYGAQTPGRIRIFGHTLVDNIPSWKLPAVREPRQGDIIVFQYPLDPNLDYIKRCVAVAGDSVQVKDGLLYVNGKLYESNFGEREGDHSCIPDWHDPTKCTPPRTYRDVQKMLHGSNHNRTWPLPGDPQPYVVPAGHIFMMGDNRYNSADSRYWGPLNVDLIKGKAMFIYWSWDRDKLRPRLNRLFSIIR